MRLVIVESPFAAPTQEGIDEHMRYLRACLHDCLTRGEAPFASHGLYTQPGVLDDTNPEERALGIEAGFQWGDRAAVRVVYTDLGITKGMQAGIDRTLRIAMRDVLTTGVVREQKIVYRSLASNHCATCWRPSLACLCVKSKCQVCGKPLVYAGNSGVVCPNGHGF